MEEFVREVLSRYTSFVSERQLYERWLDMRENSDVRDALVMTEMKITMIQSWFNLLNADERFVIESTFWTSWNGRVSHFPLQRSGTASLPVRKGRLQHIRRTGSRRLFRLLKLIEIWSWHSLAIFTKT